MDDLNRRTKELGQHSPQWTPKLIFERYFDLMERYKLKPHQLVRGLPRMLWKKMADDPNELNRWALLGALMSVRSTEQLRTTEKDFRQTPEFDTLWGWLNETP